MRIPRKKKKAAKLHWRWIVESPIHDHLRDMREFQEYVARRISERLGIPRNILEGKGLS